MHFEFKNNVFFVTNEIYNEHHLPYYNLPTEPKDYYNIDNFIYFDGK
jgi:hypothetical protein